MIKKTNLKEQAMLRLMKELNEGILSAEKDGWITEVKFHHHFHNRRNELHQ